MSNEEIAALGPMNVEELLAVIRGESLEKARKEMALSAELYEEANRYRSLPPSEWPVLGFEWDFTVDGQRFAMDGVSDSEFRALYPKGLTLGWVDFVELDAKLCHHSRRDEGELWNVGDETKLAKMVAYLARKLPITPPLVAPVKGRDELVFAGGHHRYAAYKASGRTSEIPLYLDPDNFDAVARIVSVRK